ncbi:MAG: DUF3530 family protein [Candidatus Sedimenticola endophacoides]
MGRKVFLLLLALVMPLADASDLAREQRLAAEIEETILVGEGLRLQAGGVEFFAIHALAETDAVRGGVILLHGRGAHPDWPDVIHPLRSQLPAGGWETLSIQLPVAAVDAPEHAYRELIPEAGPRIQAAVDFFKQRKLDRLVLVAHSLGSRMAVDYLAGGGPPEVKALVAIGLPVAGREGGYAALEKLTLPLLDLYGSRDIAPVLHGVKARAEAARKAGNRDYLQFEVPGADHFFRGLEQELVSRVQGWIRKAGAAMAAR